MAGRIRRLLRNRPTGRVDLAAVPALAAAAGAPGGKAGLSPSAALARRLLAEQLAGLAAERCRVLGPGRLVTAETLPFVCRMEPLPADDATLADPAELDCLLVGDALAAAMASRVLGERAGPVMVLGNVLAAATDLLGLGADRLWPEELDAGDPEYPMVVALTTQG